MASTWYSFCYKCSQSFKKWLHISLFISDHPSVCVEQLLLHGFHDILYWGGCIC